MLACAEDWHLCSSTIWREVKMGLFVLGGQFNSLSDNFYKALLDIFNHLLLAWNSWFVFFMPLTNFYKRILMKMALHDDSIIKITVD